MYLIYFLIELLFLFCFSIQEDKQIGIKIKDTEFTATILDYSDDLFNALSTFNNMRKINGNFYYELNDYVTDLCQNNVDVDPGDIVYDSKTYASSANIQFSIITDKKTTVLCQKIGTINESEKFTSFIKEVTDDNVPISWFQLNENNKSNDWKVKYIIIPSFFFYLISLLVIILII